MCSRYVLLTALVLTACGADGSDASSGSSTTATTTPSQLSAPITTAIPTATVVALAACVGAELSIGVSEPADVGNQFEVRVTVVNRADKPCVVERQPTVTLVNDAADAPRNAIVVASTLAYDSSEADAESMFEEDIVIPSDGSLSATMTYLPGPGVCDQDGRAWVPTRLVVVMPTGDEAEAAWVGDSVNDCQEGATRPGTYVDVFNVGATTR